MGRKHYACYMILCLSFVLGIYGIVISGNAQGQMLSAQEISYTTEDNVTIAGSWFLPQPSPEDPKKRYPAVILLHDYGLNRRDWGVFIPALVQKGYKVLAIDIRGHGQSREQVASVTTEDLFETGYLDVSGAIEWLKSQKGVDKKKIGVIGAGIGGDIAYFSSGYLKKKLKTAVVISPSHALLIDGKFGGIKPHSILFCTSTKGERGLSAITAQSLANYTKKPKKVVTYHSSASGLAMFYKHPEIAQEILAWLSRTIETK